MRFRFALPLAALATIAVAPLAAKAPPSPEERIGRLEKQVRQVQKRVFPKGQPADTAGLDDDPAVTQSGLSTMTSRLDAVERQMADLIRSSEENGNRLSVLEADAARNRADADRRLRALEGSASAAPTGGTVDEGSTESDEPAPASVSRPKVETAPPPRANSPAVTASSDEAAYDAGYQLWSAGKYDAAITSLKAMVAKYPDSRRVSWANNLIGRALLDKGQPRAAAEALLANYRGNPRGERAQDSLYYLGQSLVKLGQAGQACKAYGELEDVYASTLRPQIRQMLPAAKSQAKCN